MKAPKDTSGEKLEAEKAVQKKHKVEEDAFGTYASQGGEKFVYRVKKSDRYATHLISALCLLVLVPYVCRSKLPDF